MSVLTPVPNSKPVNGVNKFIEAFTSDHVAEQFKALQDEFADTMRTEKSSYIPTLLLMRDETLLASIKLRSPIEGDPVASLLEASSLCIMTGANICLFAYDSQVDLDDKETDALMVIFVCPDGVGGAVCPYTIDFSRERPVEYMKRSDAPEDFTPENETAFAEKYMDLEQVVTLTAMAESNKHVHGGSNLNMLASVLIERGHSITLFEENLKYEKRH